MISLTIPAVPVPKGSTKMRHVRGKLIVVPDNGEAQANFRNTAMPYINQAMAGKKLMTGPVALMARFYVPRPETVDRALPCVKPDLDKYTRCLCDVLTDRVWVDDGQVVDLDVKKLYASHEHTVGVVVMVMEVK